MAALGPDNERLANLFLVISGLGIGGIVVPASIISAIICPDELIATVTALTLAIRVLGGAVGYAIYYNVFVSHFTDNVKYYVGGFFEIYLHNDNVDQITTVINLTAAGLLDEICELPFVANAQVCAEIVEAGQLAYIASYPYVYYVTIAFGGISIIACLFLKNIDHYMDDHVAADYDARGPAAAHPGVVAEKQSVESTHHGNGNGLHTPEESVKV